MRCVGVALAVSLALCLTACRAAQVTSEAPVIATAGPIVGGKVDYREYVLLPRGALLSVHLLAVAEDQSDEQLLSSWLAMDPGQVPIDFALPYDRERIDGQGRYRLRAWITRGEERLFQTTKLVEVGLREDVARQRCVEIARRALGLAAWTVGFPPAAFVGGLSGFGGESDALAGSVKPWVLDIGTLLLTRTRSAPEEPAPIPLPERASVRGKLDSPARAPLPPGTTVAVSLVQAPLEAAGSEPREELVLAALERTDALALPLDFELAYDPRQVVEDSQHSIRVRIALDDAVLYLRTQRFEVDLGGELERMRAASQLAGEPVATAALDVGEVTLIAVPRPRAPEGPSVAPEVLAKRGVPVVRGELHHFEPGSLPAGAVMEVRLVASSSVDSSELELARYELQDPGRPPMAFVLEYDPAQVDDAHAYSIRAKVRLGERVLFQTTRLFSVDLWTAVQRGSGTGDVDARSVEVGKVALTRVPR